MSVTPSVRQEAVTGQWPYAAWSVGLARRQLGGVLNAWGLAHCSESAGLVLSELMTNALRYAEPAEKALIGVRWARVEGGVRIEVRDADSGRRPEVRAAGAGDEGGRGLVLVDALTGGRWGVTGVAGGGKTVWAVVGVD